MKNISKLCLAFVLALSTMIFNSCKEDEEYYIKYELHTSSKYGFSEVDAQFTTEGGSQVTSIPRNWTATFGPFKKGNYVCLIVRIKESNKFSSYVFKGKISESIGNSPFVTKVEKSNSGVLALEYIVGS